MDKMTDYTAVVAVHKLPAAIERHVAARRASRGSYYDPEIDPDIKNMLQQYRRALRHLSRPE